MNTQGGFEVPILAILYDRNNLYFYKFDEYNQKPRFLKGTFENGCFKMLVFTRIDYKTHLKRFVGQNRCVSKLLYYIFLIKYVTGLEVHWNCSIAAGKAEGQPRPWTPMWHKVLDLA